MIQIHSVTLSRSRTLQKVQVIILLFDLQSFIIFTATYTYRKLSVRPSWLCSVDESQPYTGWAKKWHPFQLRQHNATWTAKTPDIYTVCTIL